MTNVIDIAEYRTATEAPIDLLDSKLDLSADFLALLYAVLDTYPDTWDRVDMLCHVKAARTIKELLDNEERRMRDQNNTRNCSLPMFDNRSDFEAAIIDAHIEYERCARDLARAREKMLTEKDKASRKAFEAALRAVNDAELAKNRAETALVENARELALKYV